MEVVLYWTPFAILGLEKVDDSTEETLENIKDENDWASSLICGR
jgi:hypothetical protein